MIDHGKVLNASPIKAVDLQNHVSKAFYTMMIPYAWQVHGDHPVLVDAGTACGKVLGAVDWMNAKDAQQASVCVDNNQYYLLNPVGVARKDEGTPCGGPHYVDQPLSLLSGMSPLGKGTYGGVNTDWLATRYVVLFYNFNAAQFFSIED